MTTNVKRLSSIVLAAMTAMSLSACNSKPSAGAATQTPKPAASTAGTTGVVEGTEASTALFSLTYSDAWTLADDKTSDSSDYCYMELSIQENDSSLVVMDIKASVGKADSYRDKLRGSGIDAYELVEEQSVETVAVGGVDCVEYESKSWGSSTLNYLGRDEASQTTVSISVSGDLEDPHIEELIKTLKFTLTDTGNQDAPWPWQGEPFATQQHTYSVGDHSVTVDLLKLDDPLIAYDIFSGRVESTGDTVWVLLDNVIYEYQFADQALTYRGQQDLKENGDYEELSSDVNGKLYVSGFMEPMLVLQDGAVIAQYEDVDSTLMSPDGTWGISAFIGRPLKKVTLTADAAQIEEWPLRTADETSKGFVSMNHVYVTGTSDDKDNVAVWVFDTAGNQQFEFGNVEFSEDGSMGAITDVVETANGYIVFDGNMRSILFYGADGSLLASADDSDLFGTNYPWISSAAVMADGSVLVAMTEGRADDSADELLVYRLSGF